MTHRRPNGLLVLYVWPYLSLRFVGRFSAEYGLANLAFYCYCYSFAITFSI